MTGSLNLTSRFAQIVTLMVRRSRHWLCDGARRGGHATWPFGEKVTRVVDRRIWPERRVQLRAMPLSLAGICSPELVGQRRAILSLSQTRRNP